METTKAKKAKKEKPKKNWQREALEWVITLGCAVGLALLIRAFVFEPFVVKGDSMNDTLANAEVMFTTKFDYLLGEPQRFDVVICHYPNRNENFVKRIVGIPGDTVAVREGFLYVNGELQEEPYITHRPRYTYEDYTVQPGEYFVLGDNRASSNDSHLVGPLKREQIVSHVRAVFFPFGSVRGIK